MICRNCGEFRRSSNLIVYCCKTCAEQHLSKGEVITSRTNKNKVYWETITCQRCGKEVDVIACTFQKKQIYCSLSCRSQASRSFKLQRDADYQRELQERHASRKERSEELCDILHEAKKAGMSYGQYVAYKLGGK